MFIFHTIALFGPFYYIADDVEAVFNAVQDELQDVLHAVHALTQAVHGFLTPFGDYLQVVYMPYYRVYKNIHESDHDLRACNHFCQPQLLARRCTRPTRCGRFTRFHVHDLHECSTIYTNFNRKLNFVKN